MSDITELAEDWANLSIEMESDMGKTAVKLARAYLEQQKELITKSMEVEALHEKLRQALSTEDNSQELLKEAYETEIKLELKLEEQQKQIALKDEAIENIKEYNSLIPLHKNCDPHIIGYAKRIEAWCEKALTQDTSDYVLVKKEPSKEKISALVEWDRTHEYFDANDYMRDLYKSMIVSKE